MSKTNKIGKKYWLCPGGNIPFHSNGEEPEFTSRDWISVLNTSEKDAKLEIQILYESDDPVSNYEFTIKSKRMRKIRFNDFINPLPIPLEKPFGFLLHSSVEVVVQFGRMDTRHNDIAITGTMAYSQ